MAESDSPNAGNQNGIYLCKNETIRNWDNHKSKWTAIQFTWAEAIYLFRSRVNKLFVLWLIRTPGVYSSKNGLYKTGSGVSQSRALWMTIIFHAQQSF